MFSEVQNHDDDLGLEDEELQEQQVEQVPTGDQRALLGAKGEPTAGDSQITQ